MKLQITSIILILVAVSGLPGCGDTISDPDQNYNTSLTFNTNAAQSVSALSNSIPQIDNSTWLNIMYMAGDNDLDQFMQWYIDELNSIGGDHIIQHIVLRDRPGQDEVIVYTASSNYTFKLD